MYLIAGAIGAAVYYLLLSGKAGWKRIAMLLPMVLMLTAVNPLFNTYGERVLFHVFGRPYTVEALLYGAAIAGVFLVMMLWFGCYNAVMTSDKFTSLFGNLIPAISLLLVMVLRMIPSFIRKAGQIMGARKSIGLGAGENSTVREKLTCGMRTLSALTDWALEGSVVTGDSMRARGYGTAKRTSFQIYRMKTLDWTLLAVNHWFTGFCCDDYFKTSLYRIDQCYYRCHKYDSLFWTIYRWVSCCSCSLDDRRFISCFSGLSFCLCFTTI